MTIKAVLWDMDGTLVDSEHLAVEALRQALIGAGLTVPDDLYDTVVGRAADDLYRRFVRELGLALPPVAWEERKMAGYFAAIDGALAGIITDGDLRRAIDRLGDVRTVPVADVMSRQPRSISEAKLAAEAAEVMERNRVNQLLVTDEHGALAGALTMHDLMLAKVI